MDYEQFYRYLNTRPPAEIGECLQNVSRVAKNHSVPVQDAESHEASSAHNRLYISQQVWFQQAVWSKFGPRSADTIPLRELERETLSLCTTEKVGEFIVKVNKIVDEKVEQMQGDSVTKVIKQNSADTSSHSKAPDTKVAAQPHPSTPRGPPGPSTPHRCTPVALTHHTRSVILSSDEDVPDSLRGRGRAVATTTEVDSGSEVASATPHCLTPQGLMNANKRQKTKSSGNSFWTPEKDAALLAAVSEHKEEGWAAVVAHVGFEAHAKQCEQRWHSTLGPLQEGLREEAVWTDKELSRLADLVPKHTVEPYWSEHTKGMTQQYVDWKAIGKVLGRIPKKCCNKWKTVEKAQLAHPPFTRGEDALIMRREMEWGDRGVGLWAALEQEMKRPGRDIRSRWKELYEINP